MKLDALLSLYIHMLVLEMGIEGGWDICNVTWRQRLSDCKLKHFFGVFSLVKEEN